MNPYEADPNRILASDCYADLPFYGQYLPRPDDFRVDPRHVNSQTADSLQYWESVLDLCNESVRIYPADEGGRDVFALGTVIVKSSHLHKPTDSQSTVVDYSYADANEAEAVALARSALKDVRVPDIYFAGQVINGLLPHVRNISNSDTPLLLNGRQVLLQERLPGVGLTVAWPYLPQIQKESFKQQARGILRLLHTIKPSDGRHARNHVVPDPSILTNGRLNPVEREILFSGTNTDLDTSFMHNDFSTSNLVVDHDRIVGVVDWEMAGFIGWKTAGEVHRRIRTPQREHFVNANLSEERLRDIMWWNNLYDEGMPEV